MLLGLWLAAGQPNASSTVSPASSPAPSSGAAVASRREFRRGDVALVEVVLRGGNASTSAAFFPRVDELARLTVAGGAGAETDPVSVEVRLLWGLEGANASATVASERLFARAGTSVSFFEVRFDLRDGVPFSAQWVTQCDGARVGGLPADQCSSDACLENFCAVPCSNSSACNAVIFVAWRGPDADDQLCESAAILPSNFAIFSTGSIVETVTGSFNGKWTACTSSGVAICMRVCSFPHVADFLYGILNSGALLRPDWTVRLVPLLLAVAWALA